ncbi:hypothetical protein CSC17_3501 [Klebsiella oxytoca]|nr:hypothetical protein CSC17_3501 [Klebsiella oxytoca]EUC86397.1 hypothetical protein HMPREF1570_0692 [Klebsiella oxytoca KA-2]EUC93674.1 hypothetical protein HMPREF1569_4131 [Klebsiella oxytoca OK-1]
MNRNVKRVDSAPGGQILCVSVIQANVYSEIYSFLQLLV